MGKHLDGFENYGTINFELNKRFITPIINSKKSKALEKLQDINQKQEKKGFFILTGIYFTMMASGNLGLEMMEPFINFQNSTFFDLFKAEPNLKEQNPFLMLSLTLVSSIAPFLLKNKSKESEEVKKLREVKKQELEEQGLNISFQNKKDLELFFYITKEEKIIKSWILKEIDFIKNVDKKDLKENFLKSLENDNFQSFLHVFQEIASYKLEKNQYFFMPQEIAIVLKLNIDYLEDKNKHHE